MFFCLLFTRLSEENTFYIFLEFRLGAQSSHSLFFGGGGCGGVGKVTHGDRMNLGVIQSLRLFDIIRISLIIVYSLF